MELLPALRSRYYSISSSPRVNDQKLSMTVSVVEDNAWSGNGQCKGIASTYLAQLKEADFITCFVSVLKLMGMYTNFYRIKFDTVDLVIK
ncbi:hypothetical protein COI89_19295 [Bacillus cereus]|nr:hypothetical protein COI89_19295 [Bacillus cereus]